MSGPKDPLVECLDMPNYRDGADASIHMIFGLPDVKFDGSCEGLQTSMASLTANLSAFYPIIRIVNCILKIVEVIQAIPDSIGPPPDPTVLVQKLAALADCITLFLSFTGYGAIPDFIQFLADLCSYLLDVLECMRVMLEVKIDSDAQADALNASADAQLQSMGACLTIHNDALGKQLSGKFSSMEVIIILFNSIILILPPPMGGPSNQLPTGSTFTADASGLAVLDDTIAAITVVRDILEAI